MKLLQRLFGREAKQALDEEQTEGARIGQLKREFAQHPSKGLTPEKLYQILESAEQGDLKAQHELFEDMEEKDAQIASDLAKRRALTAELEWQIVPPDGASAPEKKAADFCAEVFSGIEVEDLIIDLGAGIGHGWSMMELPWVREGSQLRIEQPIFRPHSWFRLNPDDQNELRLRDMSSHGAQLWPLGWVQHRHRAKAGYVARSGLHRVLAWPYLFQNYALGDLAQLLEIYGLPARLGKYPRGATDKEKATLLRAVTSLGSNAAGIIPEGMSIEFMQAAQGKGDMFEVMMRWCEQSKTKAILGSTLTSGTGDGTNTNALGVVHERSQQALVRNDARQYTGTIKRDIIWPLVAVNFGIEDRRRAPRFYLDTGESEDYKLLSEALPAFVDMGAKIPVWWLHEKTRIPQASGKDEVLQARQTNPFGALKAHPVAALKAGDPVPADLHAQRLAETAQPAIAAWLEEIEAMLETANSMEEFKEMLMAAYDNLPEEQFAAAMSAGLEAASAAAWYDVETQAGE